MEFEVSIIIINFNANKLLEECIHSIYKFTKDIRFEIIVVDNNSTLEKVEDVVKKYSDIILVLNETNEGFAKANNKAANIAKGKYLLLLNNDTVMLENSIKIIYNYVVSQGDPLLVGPRLLNSDGTFQNSVYSFPSPLNLLSSNLFLYKIFPMSSKLNKTYFNIASLKSPFEVDVIIGAFMFLKKDLFIGIGGFDERFQFYHEDTDLCYRFRKGGGKVVYYSNTSVIHMGGGTTKNYLWFQYRNRSIALIKLIQKHYVGLYFLICICSHYIGMIIRIPLFLIIGIFLLKKELILRAIYVFRTIFIYPKNLFK
jgi:GT2 family glycosyltransferase